jgi:Galactose-3-O-sulfotransferase
MSRGRKDTRQTTTSSTAPLRCHVHLLKLIGGQPRLSKLPLFVKTYTTGASTAAGINIRIARNEAQRQGKDAMCKTRFDREAASQIFPKRDPAKSFAWTVVRDPTMRLVSLFFHFDVSRDKLEPSDYQFLNRIRSENGQSPLIRNHYLNHLTIQPGLDNARLASSKVNPVEVIQQIVDQYDFIAVTERMDESLVAMALLNDLPLSDVMYLQAKNHGSYDEEWSRKDKTCLFIWPSFVSKGMEEIFQTNEFQDIVHWDHVLYQVANLSLDMTIAKIGVEVFREALEVFQLAQRVAHGRCVAQTRFPCDDAGHYHPLEATDCLWHDSACGLDCLDQVARELGIDRS